MPRGQLTPQQRRDLSAVANGARWGHSTKAERVAATQPARDALMQKYIDQVEPDMGILDDGERESDRLRRANLLRRADLARYRLRKSRAS